MSRPLRNSERVKLFTLRALRAKLRKLEPAARFSTYPRLHQLAGFLLGVQHKAYLFLWDMGLGKTKLSLDLARHAIRSKKAKRFLILVPNTSNIEAWREQVQTHSPTLRMVGMDVSGSEARQECLDSDSQIVVVTYMGLLALVCDHDRTGKRMVINKKKLKRVLGCFEGVVYDEITAAANPQSLTFRVCRHLSKHCTYRFGLTGTPFGRNLEDLWAQFYLIDFGETLGETLGLYRAGFFTEKQNYWSGWPVFEFNKKKAKLLHRVIRNRSLRYAESECLDLPGRTDIVKHVVFPEETWAYYERLSGEMREAQRDGDFKAIKGAFIRLRQLAAGFLRGKNAQGEDAEIVFSQNPKIDLLRESVAEVRQDRKLIIFHIFQKSGELISAALKQDKRAHVRLYGKTRNKGEVVRRFMSDPKCRILVCSSAGAYGLNLQIANYAFFFESPTDPRVRQQMVARIARSGQRRKVFVTDIVMKNSADEKILGFVKEGKDLADAILEGEKL